MVQRQPADNHVVGVQVDAEPPADQHLIGDQIAVGHLNAFGQGRRTRGVLQKGHVISLQSNGPPGVHGVGFNFVDTEHVWRICRAQLAHLQQGLAQRATGQQQARLGIIENRQQTLLVMALARLGWIRRHGDDARVQTGKEGRDVVRAAREQQHRPITHSRMGLQGDGNCARPKVQVVVGEHLVGRRVIGQKAQRLTIRGQSCTLRKG